MIRDRRSTKRTVTTYNMNKIKENLSLLNKSSSIIEQELKKLLRSQDTVQRIFKGAGDYSNAKKVRKNISLIYEILRLHKKFNEIEMDKEIEQEHPLNRVRNKAKT